MVRVAETLGIDALTAEIAVEFEARGLPVVLLKGPAIADWLYHDSAIRVYGDVDLLVPPREWGRAQRTLTELGFVDCLGPLAHPRMESGTSFPFVRHDDGMKPHENVDLHCTLWGMDADPEQVWRVLSGRIVTMRVGGRDVPVLAPGPRALHVALHAAQHGPDARKPLRDLELAVSLLPIEIWEEAAQVAAGLQATGTFATGLGLLPEGRDLARRLGVADMESVDALIRAAYVPLAEGFEQLSTTRGIGPKLALIRKELFPSTGFMRWWSPLARRGGLGLTAAYLWRPLWMASRAGPGFLAWRRARRRAATS